MITQGGFETVRCRQYQSLFVIFFQKYTFIFMNFTALNFSYTSRFYLKTWSDNYFFVNVFTTFKNKNNFEISQKEKKTRENIWFF